MNRHRLLTSATAAAAAAVATLVVVVPAGPASAHTELKSTAPAAKSTTTKPVTEVTLTFTGLIKKPGTTVAVTGPDQASHGVGTARVLDKTITQKVQALPVGTITVAWRTVAADGHPMQGSFTFTNRAAPPTTAQPSPTPDAAPTTGATAPAATTPPAQVPAPAAGEDTDDGLSSALWWVVVTAVAVVLALAGGLLWRRRRSTGS